KLSAHRVAALGPAVTTVGAQRPGQSLLQTLDPPLLAGGGELPVVQVAVGGDDGDGDAPVDTDRRVAVRRDFGYTVLDAERDVPTPPVPTDGGVTDCPAERSGPPEPDRTELRQPDLAPPAVESAHRDVVRVREPERRCGPRLGPPPHLEGAVSLAGALQVPQRLLQRMRRGVSQPRTRRILLGFGHLPGLFHIRDKRAPTPILPALLQAGVPNRTADRPDRFGIGGLLRREREQVTAAGQHSAALLLLDVPLHRRQRGTAGGRHEVRVRPQRRQPGPQCRKLLAQHPRRATLD